MDGWMGGWTGVDVVRMCVCKGERVKAVGAEACLRTSIAIEYEVGVIDLLACVYVCIHGCDVLVTIKKRSLHYRQECNLTSGR